MKKAVSKSRKLPLLVEALEDRRLMAGEPWGTFPKLIGQDQAVANYPSLTGKGMAIAVIDTGVDYMHPALGAGFGPGHKVVAGWDFIGNDADPMDTDGHGTGIAGLIAANEYVYNGQKYKGLAPDADIIALRADTGTYGYNKAVPYYEQALQWVIAHADEYNIVAVNMSFGRGHFTDPAVLAPIDDELAALNSMGILLVSSSGNDGAGTGGYGVEYPAADPNVYGVGSIDSNDAISTFTERGPGMDLLAPGNLMPMPFYLPATGQHIILGNGNGTSFAVPYICAMGALLKQLDPTLTPAEMISIMQRSGVDNYDGDNESGLTTGMTFKRLQVNNALSMAFEERNDIFEGNGSFASATAISFTGDNASIGGLRLLQGDTDYYKFTLGALSDVDFNVGASTGLSIDLLSSTGTKLTTLSMTDAMRLSAGTYFIRVNAPAATVAGSYSISLARTADDAHNNHTTGTALHVALTNGKGSVSGMSLLKGADDYFSFDLTSVSDVDLVIDYGGASAAPGGQILDANGNYVADFSGSISRRLDTGRYYVRVTTPVNLDGTYGVGVAATAYVPPAAPPPTPGANGSTSGIAYDASGNLHFAWYDEAAQNLKYAVRSNAGVWGAITTVDAGQAAGQYISIAIDKYGYAGIAYFDAYNADLKYAHFNGSSWDVGAADSRNTTGYYPSLQFDNAARPVISYFYKTGADLRFATLGGSGWVIGAIDTAGDVGRSSSLAYNPLTGRWAVAYEDTGRGTFKYADQTKSGWAPVTFDGATRGGGGYISLAFTLAKRPAISYYDAYNADLKFATFNGSKWSTQVVAAKGTVGMYSNVRVDPTTGATDILYFHKNSDQVWRAKLNGSSWGLTSVTSTGGRWISRAFYAGNETIAYVDGADLDVLDI